ncbi:MAG: TonB-dependent receptor [Acidobacteriota bacterium]
MIAHRVWLLSATALGLICLGGDTAQAQALPPAAGADVVRVAAVTAGSIYGAVLDEAGEPIGGAVVSALGGATAFAVTDRAGAYSLAALPPGPYVVRAHHDGFAGARGTLINVRPASRAPSSFTLRRTDDAPNVVVAGVAADAPAETAARDESPLAWRLRRLTRSVLKEEQQTAPVDLQADDDWFLEDSLRFLGRAVESSARFAASAFTEWPLYGQVNLLTATAYDDSGEVVDFGRSSGVAFFAVGAPVGAHADWSARASMNSGDVTSWTMAGDYITRAPARSRITAGMTYSLQRYQGGNFAALQAVPDGHRKVASLSAAHEFDLTPRWTIGYGARYEHYDYLDGYGLVSPSLKVSFAPVASVRLHAKASLHQVAPGAEEFVPPADAQWVPPQRTFSPLGQNRFATEMVQSYELGATRQFTGFAIGVRTFRQHVDDQLVTVFGAADPARLIAAGGHYGVASAGDADMRGWGIGLTHNLSGYVHGRIDYTLLNTSWQASTGADRAALAAQAPRALRLPNERLHDVTTTLEAEVPQTATRFYVLYRLNSGFAGDPVALQSADGRFDMQLRQGLPFMSGVKGDWEMLLGVRSLFRQSVEDRSIYDELLVVRAPKRVIGGIQVRF